MLLYPEMAICTLAVLVLICDLVLIRGTGVSPVEHSRDGHATAEDLKHRTALGWITALGLALVLLATVYLAASQVFVPESGYYERTLFGGTFIFDGMAFFFKVAFLLAALLVTLASVRYAAENVTHTGEYYTLLLFSTAGLMLMASAGDLLLVFLGLELASISLYALAGYLKKDPQSGEAGLKYLVLGAISSGVLLYGISLLYGFAGSTALIRLQEALTMAGGVNPAVLLGLVMVAAGFSFKMVAVPFHMWAPDVYQGAPTPVTAFLSVASKAAGFAVALRVFGGALIGAKAEWGLLLATLAALSMVLGNLVAIHQSNIKRMLAYSGVAQAGYLLIGVTAADRLGAQAVMFYIFLYIFTNAGAFFVALAVERGLGTEQIADYRGLSRRAPLLAISLLILLLSLAGIPPLGGFWGKIFLFKAGIGAGLYWLVAIGVLASVVSLYYYLMVIRQMYIEPWEPGPVGARSSGRGSSENRLEDEAPTIVAGFPLSAAVLICVVVTVALGYPSPILQFADAAARAIFPR